MKKSWSEKLKDSKELPKIAPIDGRMSRRWGQGTFVVPAPIEVDALMKRVPRGKLITIDQLRAMLAQKHRVNVACPLTTGIFAWIAAHAAEESLAAGKKQITPYWRTLKSKGEINPKYPGGLENISALLQQEGHTVVQKGKRAFVRDFEKSLVRGMESRL